MQNLKKWFEPIGLLLVLLAFGWQCVEERTEQMKVESYFYEMNEKMIAIWSGIYDEALHSERYDGKAMVSVNYDSMKDQIKDWGQIQKELSTIKGQSAIFFWIRAALYVIGSIFVVLSKFPDNQCASRQKTMAHPEGA